MLYNFLIVIWLLNALISIAVENDWTEMVACFCVCICLFYIKTETK